MDTKYARLQDILYQMESVLIAFSGGVDSTLLLKAAIGVLGNRVLAVTAISETTPKSERDDAIEYAKTFGANHMLIETRELDIPEFAANPEDKCYICKKYRFSSLVKLAAEKNIAWVADGQNTDDLNDYRPGIRAVRELGIRSPLHEAGFSKADIRSLSKQLGLPTWNKPAIACLATRIPYHSPITAKKLGQADEGETFLRNLGLSGHVRVRHHGDTARIETDADGIRKLVENDIRISTVAFFKNLGFGFVTLDLEGYVMGSLNRELNQQKKTG